MTWSLICDARWFYHGHNLIWTRLLVFNSTVEIYITPKFIRAYKMCILAQIVYDKCDFTPSPLHFPRFLKVQPKRGSECW